MKAWVWVLPYVWLALVAGLAGYNYGMEQEKERRPYPERRCPAGTHVMATDHCLACCPIVNGRVDSSVACAVAVCMEDSR